MDNERKIQHKNSNEENDSLFFLDHIPEKEVSVIMDYGCADGILLQRLRNNGPDWKEIGIDKDIDVLELFKLRNPNATFIKSRYPLTHRQADPKNCVLHIGNMLSDLYASMTPKEMPLFWYIVFSSGYKYVVINDKITDQFPLTKQEFMALIPEDYEIVYENTDDQEQIQLIVKDAGEKE